MLTRFSLIRAVVAALTVLAPFGAQAETVADFLARIARAIASPDNRAALRDLYYIEGMDADAIQRYVYDDPFIATMLGIHGSPSLAVEPLPPDFRPVWVGRGYEYRPNLPPLGYVVVDRGTIEWSEWSARAPYGGHDDQLTGWSVRSLYGRRDDRYFLVVRGMRVPIENPAGPERTLTMYAFGIALPPMRFGGYCEVLLANGDRKKITLDDEGANSQSISIAGVRIEACELRNLSGRGRLMLQLREGGEQIFDQQVEFPETAISFAR